MTPVAFRRLCVLLVLLGVTSLFARMQDAPTEATAPAEGPPLTVTDEIAVTEIPVVPVIPSATETPTPTHLPTEPPALTLEATADATEQPEVLPSHTTLPTLTDQPTISLPLLSISNFETEPLLDWSADSWPRVATNEGHARQYVDGAMTYTVGLLTDVRLSSSVMLSRGQIEVRVRDSAAGVYRGVLSSTGILSLYRDDTLLQTTQVAVPADTWLPLYIEAVGASVSIRLNDALLSVTDPAPLPSGRMSMTAATDSLLRVDDVALYGVMDGMFAAPLLPTLIPTNTETPAIIPVTLAPLRTYDFSQLRDWTIRDWIYDAAGSALIASQSRGIAELDNLILADGALEVAVTLPSGRFRLLGHISYDSTTNIMSAYTAEYTAAGLSLARNGIIMASAPISLSQGSHRLGMEMIGAQVTVLVDGLPVLVYNDPLPLPAGTFGMQAPDSWAAENAPRTRVLVDSATLFAPVSPTPMLPMASSGYTTIGDRVWADTNTNGVQDIGEAGVANVSVEIWLDDTIDSQVATVFTNATGLYSLTAQSGFAYYLKIRLPSGTVLTNANATSDARDSDFAPVTYRTQTFFTYSSDDLWDWDAGLMLLNQCSPGTDLDIGLVLDGSSSIGPANFDLVRNFAIGVVNSFSLGKDDVRVSIVQFSSTASTKIESRLIADRANLTTSLIGMIYQGGNTDIATGIEKSQSALQGTKLEERSKAKVPRVMIVLTDGEHNAAGSPESKSLAVKDAQTVIYTIGVSGYNRTQLEAIASDVQHVLTVDTFEDLLGILPTLTAGICNTPAVLITAPKGTAPLSAAALRGSTLTFSWTFESPFMTPRYGGQYVIEVDDNPAFTDPELTERVTANSLTPMLNLPPHSRYYWRVQAQNSRGAGPWSSILPFTLDVVAPTLSSPLTNTISTDSRPTFTWTSTAATGAKHYRLQIAANPQFDELLINERLAANVVSYRPIKSLPQGNVYWRVQALDGISSDGPWSPTRLVSINSAIGPAHNANLIPKPPSIYTTYSTVFSWTALAGVKRIQVQVSASETFDQIIREAAAPSSTSTSLTIKAPNALPWGVYWWRLVIDRGSGPEISPHIQRFTLTPPLPAAPTQAAPLLNAYTHDTTPTLSWKAVSYPYAGLSLTYDYQVDTTRSFLSPEIDIAGLNALSFTSDTVLTDSLYYWRVRAVNNLGVAGAWSLVRSFTVDTAPPPAPLALVPIGAATTTVRPTMKWKAVVGGGSMTYHLQIDNQSSFSSPEIEVGGLKTASKLLTQSLGQGLQYWRVKASDGAGNEGSYSSPQVIVVDSALTPGPNASFKTGAVGFTWSAIPGARAISVQISTTPTFGTLVRTVSASRPTSGALNATNALPFGVYYWRLAVNLNGTVVPSPLWRRITITPPLPAAPILISPNSNTNIIDTLVFSWANVPYRYQGQTLTYEIVIDDNSAFTSPEQRLVSSVPTVTSTPALPPGHYYWRVRAVNDLSGPGPWSLTRIVRVLP